MYIYTVPLSEEAGLREVNHGFLKTLFERFPRKNTKSAHLMDAIATSPWFQPPSHNLHVVLPNFCSSEVKTMNSMSLQITPKLSTVSITQALIEFLVNKIMLIWNQRQNSCWLQQCQSSRWWWCEVFLHFMYLYQSYLDSYNDVH